MSHERRQRNKETYDDLKHASESRLASSSMSRIAAPFAAKQVLDAGANLATVSRLLGRHERLETTAIYTQPTAQDLEAAVRRLERDAD